MLGIGPESDAGFIAMLNLAQQETIKLGVDRRDDFHDVCCGNVPIVLELNNSLDIGRQMV